MSTINSQNTQPISYSLLEGRISLRISPNDGGKLSVRALADDDVVFSENLGYGFWLSDTKKGEIKNRISENTMYDKSAVSTSLTDVWIDLRENHIQLDSPLVRPEVIQFLENTKVVEVHPRDKPGGETEYHIIFDKRGVEGDKKSKIVLKNSEWVARGYPPNTAHLATKYEQTFEEDLPISWGHWERLIRPKLSNQLLIKETPDQ